MTGLLKDLMEERANREGTPTLDLDAIIQTGDRRVRRRRVVTGGAVAAVAAAVLTVVAISPASLDLRGDKAQPATSPPGQSNFQNNVSMYALGTDIHYGSQVVSVAPHQISSFVVTGSGFVFTTLDNAVFLTDGNDVTQIGTTSDSWDMQKLVAGINSPYVGWVDGSTSTPEFVVYNTETQEEVVRTDQGSDPNGQDDAFTLSAMIAIDGDTAYWHNSQGIISYDIPAGTSEVMQPGAAMNWLYDVVDGVYATQTDEGAAIHVGTDPNAVDPFFVPGGMGALSPSGTQIAIEHDDVADIFNVATGGAKAGQAPKALDLTAVGYPFRVFGQWIDDDTFTEFGLTNNELTGPNQGEASFDLLICSVSSGACSLSQEDIGRADTVLRPDGTSKS